MQAINRAMKIINVFIANEPNRFYSITDLARKCDLPVSSMHRILNAMIKHDMIKQDRERKLYGLGTVWLEYGLKVYDTMDYISVLRPELENLRQSVEASVYLRRPIGKESIIIERIDCISQTIRAHDKLGLRTPMHIGAANLAMLANMPSDKAEEIIRQLVSEEERSDFNARLDKIRTDGYAAGQDERGDDISTVAAPILNHYGEVVGAVNIRVKSFELTDERKKFVVDEVVNAANKISWKMGYQS